MHAKLPQLCWDLLVAWLAAAWTAYPCGSHPARTTRARGATQTQTGHTFSLFVRPANLDLYFLNLDCVKICVWTRSRFAVSRGRIRHLVVFDYPAVRTAVAGWHGPARGVCCRRPPRRCRTCLGALTSRRCEALLMLLLCWEGTAALWRHPVSRLPAALCCWFGLLSPGPFFVYMVWPFFCLTPACAPTSLCMTL